MRRLKKRPDKERLLKLRKGELRDRNFLTLKKRSYKKDRRKKRNSKKL